MAGETTHVHGTAIAMAVDADGPLAGALLVGSSGSGKSALAVSAVESCPWRRTALVADDATLLFARAGGCWARAPEAIAGLIELRGFGPVRVRTAAEVKIIAVVELDRAPARLPEPRLLTLAPGCDAPAWAFQPSPDGAARLRLLLKGVLGGHLAAAAHDGAAPPGTRAQEER